MSEPVLEPLFGTYCRSQPFTRSSGGGSGVYEYFEAFLDDPGKCTWSVTRVTVEGSGANARRRVKPVSEKIDFAKALDLVASFEKNCLARPQDHTPLLLDPSDLGFSHYRAFAEREGYVFDEDDRPHARPHANSLPAGKNFRQRDIDRANRHMQRAADDFYTVGTRRKIPNTLFLFDAFTRAALRTDMPDRISEGRVVSLLDTYMRKITEARDRLREYCDTYEQLGKGGLIDSATQSLEAADILLRQLAGYHVNTEKFILFNRQCMVMCHVLHAQGLYDLMYKGKGDFIENEKTFNERVGKAFECYRKIDPSEDGLRALEQMIRYAPHPSLPPAIDSFIDNYHAQRLDYTTKQQSAITPPHP